MSKNKHILALAAANALVAGCAGSGSTAGTPSSAELDALTQQIIKADFHDKGIVKVAEAFRDDETIRVCNAADVAGKPLDNATAKRIVSEVIAPRLKEGDFFGGVSAGIDQMMRVIDGEPLPLPKQSAARPDASARKRARAGTATRPATAIPCPTA